MNEAETRAEYIDPALRQAGWGVVVNSRVRREYPITAGLIQGHGKRGKALTADYVLEYRNTKLAVLEAKAVDKPYTEGVGQAKDYADKMAIRFAYASNGRKIYEVDMHTGREQEVAHYPTPDQLWARTFAQPDLWRDRFAEIAFEDKGGSHPGRYYQETAVERVLEAIAQQQKRILLTLATGTGKTFIAFQIAWKLFHSRWSLTGQPTRRPRILFLADRNILANQAYNAFSAFAEDAMVRINPADISKKGKVPTNGNLFFTIFQTFMSGPIINGQPTPSFGQYPADFFDLIIIDECHRGGANDESTWRAILDYFAPAVQLGLTATPKRTDNVNTYAYFGEPVYIYSLKDGINDGFLTPFKVRQVETSLDSYVYDEDDEVLEGEVEEGKEYTEADFNRTIEIEERERMRVELFMEAINQQEKTLVFCANQAHALFIRDLINQVKESKNPHYCHRVTADDGGLGEQYLRDFQDNEKNIPTILTTSHKLSTGVDARNVRNIVLLRPINSLIEFKQIIGRGTRLFEGKFYFTIYDFVQAYHHFNDPEWDGEPLDPPEPPTPRPEVIREVNEREDEYTRPEKVVIKLGDNRARTIAHTVTSQYLYEGRPVSAQEFIELLFGTLPFFFESETQLREMWSRPETRQTLLVGLGERGFGAETLQEMQRLIDAEQSDLFDVLAYVAYAKPPRTRAERAEQAKKEIDGLFTDQQQAFLQFVLSHYVQTGVEELEPDKLPSLLQLKYNRSMEDAKAKLGEVKTIRELFVGFQKFLYQPRPGV